MQESSVYRAIQTDAKADLRREIAINALRSGMSVEVAANLTGLSIEEVQQLQEQWPAASQVQTTQSSQN